MQFYENRLEITKQQWNLVMCYKIVVGIVAVKFEDFLRFVHLLWPGDTHGKLFRPRGDIIARYNLFTVRVLNVWNYLSVDMVDFRNISAFKKTGKLANFRRFLEKSILQ